MPSEGERLKIRPLRDWMLLEVEDKVSTFIALPDTVKDSLNDASDAVSFTVLDVGPGWEADGQFHSSPVSIGDTVIMEGKLAVAQVQYAGHKLLLGQARYVALVIEKGGTSSGRDKPNNSKA